MSATPIAIPPLLTALIGHLAAAVPARARTTFTELLVGTATTRGVTDAILAAGLTRSWTTYYWFLEYGRWTWLAVWQALPGILAALFAPTVWYVVIDDTERGSARLAGPPQPYRQAEPAALRARLAVPGCGGRARLGAVPLMLRLVRRGANRGKLRSARFLVRLLGDRLGRVRLLLDAWFMRGWLVLAADGHTVIGRVRRDLALYTVPRPARGKRRRGRPRKYGERMTRERIGALPLHRSAQILYGNLEVVRYRTALVTARFLKGRVVRAVWVQLERPDRRQGPSEERLLICTDPALSATEIIAGYAKRWAVEPLFAAMKHQFGLKDAWQQTRQVLMRTLVAAGYALSQILLDPARLPGLADPAPWRPRDARTAGLVQAGFARILGAVGLPALIKAIPRKLPTLDSLGTAASRPETAHAA
jgi:hypothetical protein